MKFWTLILAVLTLTLPFYGAAAQTGQLPEPYDNPTSPVDLLSSYYNAINRAEYERAYGYWQTAPDSYETFVRGFAQTEQVQLIIQPPARIGVAAGSQYVDIPTVLIAELRNGTQQTFAGCFVTRKSNLQVPDVPEEATIWHLYSADLEQVANNASIPDLLAEACAPAAG